MNKSERTAPQGLKPGTATREKGRERVAAIIQAAREVLMDAGYSQFSLRNVAARAGIHLSNLQYYFPSREALIRAISDDIGRRYAEVLEENMSRRDSTPWSRLDAHIEFLLDDIQNLETRRLFIQFWALAGSVDAYAGRLLQDLYRYDIEQIAALIRGVKPEIEEPSLKERATLIAAMIEGMMLMIGLGDNDREHIETLCRGARFQALRIATEP